jgi:hypothetical protein
MKDVCSQRNVTVILEAGRESFLKIDAGRSSDKAYDNWRQIRRMIIATYEEALLSTVISMSNDLTLSSIFSNILRMCLVNLPRNFGY